MNSHIPRLLGSLLMVSSFTLMPPAMADAPQSAPAAAVSPALTEAHADFLRKIHRINQAEIEVGQLAERRGTTPVVKDYGRTLVKDHQDADQKVTDLAKADGIDLDPKAVSKDLQALDDKLTTMDRELNQATNRSFDSLFAEKMIAGHDDAITLVKTAQRDLAPIPDFVKLENELLPQLRKHRDMAQALTAREMAH